MAVTIPRVEITGEPLACNVHDRLLADAEIIGAIEKAIHAAREYRVTQFKLDLHLDPVSYLRELERKLGAATSPDEIERLRHEHAEASAGASGNAGQSARHAARQVVRRQAAESKAAIADLLRMSLARAAGWLEDAKLEECRFFNRFNLRWRATEVSAGIERSIADLKRCLEQMEASSPHSTTGFFSATDNPLTEWFGIKLEM